MVVTAHSTGVRKEQVQPPSGSLERRDSSTSRSFALIQVESRYRGCKCPHKFESSEVFGYCGITYLVIYQGLVNYSTALMKSMIQI